MDLIGCVLLNKYRIEKKIGEGGMGHVYRAQNIRTGEHVAIKILKEDLYLKDTYLRRFKREIRSGSLLDHPGIVKLIDEGKLKGKPFLVMEYVEGQNLRQWARNKRRTISLIVEKFEKICEAINDAHRKGIIHRDLKPENVLVTYSGDIKIMDFGLARRVQESSMITSPGTFIGTVVYTSPEQASGKKIDTRCDIYAIGVMLFEMTTGKLPFKGEDPIAVLFQHIHNDPPPVRKYNKDIPLQLEKIISQAMSKDPGQRPQTAGELASMLRRLREKKEEPPTVSITNSRKKREKAPVTAGVKSAAAREKNLGALRSQQLARGNVELTFLLLELSNFLSATEDLDYPTVQKFLDAFSHRLESEVLKFKGKVVQMGGHRAFYVFRSFDEENFARSAVESAINIQKSIEQLQKSGIQKQLANLNLNISLQTANLPAELVLDENIPNLVSRGKYYHTANLILKQSRAIRGSCILACGTTFDKVRQHFSGQLFKKFYVRGRMEPVRIFLLDWEIPGKDQEGFSI